MAEQSHSPAEVQREGHRVIKFSMLRWFHSGVRPLGGRPGSRLKWLQSQRSVCDVSIYTGSVCDYHGCDMFDTIDLQLYIVQDFSEEKREIKISSHYVKKICLDLI